MERSCHPPSISILVASPYFDGHISGVDAAAGQIARHLSKEGFSVTWTACDCFAPTSDAGIRIEPLACSNAIERLAGLPLPIVSLRGLGRLAKMVKDHDAVVVHNTTSPVTLACLIYARLWSRPVILAQHGGHPPTRWSPGNMVFGFLLRLLVPRLALLADRLVVSSYSTVAALNLRKLAARTDIVMNGVDADLYTSSSLPRPARIERLGITSPQPICLFVGRFVENKGLALLKAAATERTDITWAFAGTGLVDPEAWGLANVVVARDLPAEALVTFYQGSDLLVLPSVREGFPLVIKEALSCGLPIVCSRDVAQADPELEGLLEVLELSGRDPVHQRDELLRAIDVVLARSPAARAEVAAQGRMMCLGRYSWEACGAAYAEIVRSLIGGTCRRAAPRGSSQASSRPELSETEG